MLIGVKDSQSDLEKHYKTFCGLYVFMWKLSPPISPPVKCGILLQFAVWIKRKTADND